MDSRSLLVGGERERRESLDDETYQKKVNDLAAEIRCGPRLADELLTLAGGDANLVRDGSMTCQGINAVKAYIIDRRFKKNKLD